MAAITITKQDACFVDTRIGTHGCSKRYHFVVRRTPFAIHIGAAPGTRDFNHGVLTCQLLHASPDLKPVENNPLEFLARPSADGATCAIDCRVLVLSSHSSSKAFVIKISHTDTSGNHAEVTTQPIVSVAKQQQIRNRMAEVEKSLNRDTQKHSIQIAKRPRAADLVTMLGKIAATQQKQQTLLEKALRLKPEAPTLESAVTALVDAYLAEDASERPKKLRRLLGSYPPPTKRLLADIGSVLSAPRGEELRSQPESEGLEPEPFLNATGSSEPQLSHWMDCSLVGMVEESGEEQTAALDSPESEPLYKQEDLLLFDPRSVSLLPCNSLF